MTLYRYRVTVKIPVELEYHEQVPDKACSDAIDLVASGNYATDAVDISELELIEVCHGDYKEDKDE